MSVDRAHGRVIFASSLGTVFEWFDFYLYGTLAVFFGTLFFPPGNDTAAFLASLATFGAGFAVRPLGALVFGRLGDLIGRKYTFLITIVVMGLATALVGVLPTYAQVGIWAPVLLVSLRLAQGLAARRRIRRRRDLCSRARAADAARLLHELDSDHRDARVLFVVGGDPRLSLGVW